MSSYSGTFLWVTSPTRKALSLLTTVIDIELSRYECGQSSDYIGAHMSQLHNYQT